MLRAVLDTDVLVAALLSDRGASRALVLAALDGEFVFLMSTALLLEYEAVLTRPSILESAAVVAADVASVLDELAAICSPVAANYRWRPQARDPNDDFVIEAAVSGRADVIASFNVRDIEAGARRFGIAVERPGDVLKNMRRG